MEILREKIICEAYLDFIRGRKCVVCGNGLVDPDHLIARGWRESKRNDFTCVPLCRMHHTERGQTGIMTFEQNHGINLWRDAANLLVEFFLLVKEGKVGENGQAKD